MCIFSCPANWVTFSKEWHREIVNQETHVVQYLHAFVCFIQKKNVCFDKCIMHIWEKFNGKFRAIYPFSNFQIIFLKQPTAKYNSLKEICFSWTHFHGKIKQFLKGLYDMHALEWKKCLWSSVIVDLGSSEVSCQLESCSF